MCVGMEPVELSDPRHRRVLDWVTTAPVEREPRTQTALADEMGVSARTVRDWMGRDDFKQAWRLRVDALAGSPERTQSALDRLFDKAMDESNPSPERQLKLYWEMIKAISPPEVNVNVMSRRAQDLSNDELEDLIAGGAVDVLKQRNHLREVA